MLVGLLACGWTFGARSADSAGSPSRHIPSSPRPTPRPHVIVLIPPYAVYAAKSPARPKPGVGAVLRAAGLVSQAPLCAAGTIRRLAAHPSSHTPATVDLSRFDPPVADEGAVHAGAAWATGYTLLGWWAAKQGFGGAPFAAMSLYAPLTHEANHAVTLAAALALLARQGIDPQAAYRHGHTDYRHRPTAAEQANAHPYRIAGYSCVYTQRHSPVSAEAAIKAVLASGEPLVLGVPVYDSILHASRALPFVDRPSRGAKAVGAEAVVAVAYDGNGVWVQNSWGSAWGLAGYAELSWSFVNSALQDAWTIAVAPKRAPTTTRQMLVVTATPTFTTPVTTNVPATYTAPISGTAVDNGLCVPGTPATSTTPASTGTIYPPSATATPTGSPSSANATPTGAVPSGTGTFCGSDFSFYTGTATPYPSSYSAYPTDTSAYATGVAAYPTTTYSADTYPYPISTYPTDISPYLTSTDVPVTTTPTASRTAITTPTASPTATATPSPTPMPQVAVLPTSGTAGSIITVSGMGFTPGRLTVQFDGSTIGYFIAGNAPFSFPLTVPANPSLPNSTITLSNEATGEKANTAFTVIAPTPTPTLPPPSPMNTIPPPTATATASATATPTASATVT